MSLVVFFDGFALIFLGALLLVYIVVSVIDGAGKLFGKIKARFSRHK